MDIEERLQIVTGKYLATQALSHVLILALLRANPDLLRDLKDGLNGVYDVLPSGLTGAALKAFDQEWKEIHRLISQQAE